MGDTLLAEIEIEFCSVHGLQLKEYLYLYGLIDSLTDKDIPYEIIRPVIIALAEECITRLGDGILCVGVDECPICYMNKICACSKLACCDYIVDLVAEKFVNIRSKRGH